MFFSFPATNASGVEISIQDSRGREVWGTTEKVSGGVGELSWNGILSGKRSVAPGIYWARIRLLDSRNLPTEVIVRKISIAP